MVENLPYNYFKKLIILSVYSIVDEVPPKSLVRYLPSYKVSSIAYLSLFAFSLSPK